MNTSDHLVKYFSKHSLCLSLQLYGEMMENIHEDRNIINKCQSLKDLENRDETSKKNASLPNLIVLNDCEINFTHSRKEENSGTLKNGHVEHLPNNIPFQQKIKNLVGKHKQEKPENSGKIGLFQWFLRFFGVFFVSLRFPTDNPIS